jgi:hypothetical protein
VQWNRPENLGGALTVYYNLKVEHNDEIFFEKIGIRQTSSRLVDLEPGEVYQVSISAGNDYGVSEWSETLMLEFYHKPTPPQIPGENTE